ncbi:tripartite tricarboxylate transporter TctB family protein [Natronococcus sp. A-GB7]|uniref:tripartite tricarboxylate transporter TctB family protein n=1 Tax=Natronococcus sp. A-GB7 TaxID=3037649 RepID=UPI0024204BF7|nr:tripartite tricarboxylate transporter TctB family protein [Natronococcus sp. A-GB7]MDG5818563.1 tripartite tricarboxylate transporter TctB family protein [Natronococcus sp. A-GB7]
MTRITPPTVTMSTGSRTLEIDTGELLFPGLVLAFCLFYYWDTRALPELSMLYAGPLLYTTIALAVVTVAVQAVSVGGGDDPRGGGDGGVESAAAAFDPDSDPEADEEAVFTVRSAAVLIVLTAGYIVALEPIGFLAATVAFLAATLYLFGERNPLALAGYSLGFAIGVWLVFVQWLMIPL